MNFSSQNIILAKRRGDNERAVAQDVLAHNSTLLTGRGRQCGSRVTQLQPVEVARAGSDLEFQGLFAGREVEGSLVILPFRP